MLFMRMSKKTGMDILLLCFLSLMDTTSTFSVRKSAPRNRPLTLLLQETNNYDDTRRELLQTAAVASSLFASAPAWAAPIFGGRLLQPQPSSLYVVNPQKNATESLLQREPVIAEPYQLSSELCLLKLLPVKNAFFRELQDTLEGLSEFRANSIEAQTWKEASKLIENAISQVDKRRGSLEPVFNPEEEVDTMLLIVKAERGEQLIEEFRTKLVRLSAAIRSTNVTQTLIQQKEALLALSQVGELLVTAFPYEIPTEGKFSYLPRLLGRARVTFTFRRGTKMLGNVTIVADGYAAPLTAGNFVDLSVRNFYTGLPIKFTKKRLGSGSDFEVANIPILGSYQEGFYDPLTAKPRRLPLELIRVERNTGVPNLSYSQGLSSLANKLEPTGNSKPLLSFNIPGLVAMNHPDKNLNGASSEFFSLQQDSMLEEKRTLLDGEYAPFGYIIDGYNLFQTLQPNDVIDDTYVDEWGQLNLVKLRRSSFSEVVQGNDEAA